MLEPIITKNCRACKRTKPIAEFYKEKSNKDGHRNKCKTCHLKYMKEYHQTKKGKVAQRKGQARYRKTDKNKAAQKRYWQSEKGKVVQKRFRVLCPEHYKAKSSVNNAVKLGKLLSVSSLTCYYCGTKAEQYHHPSYEPKHHLDVIPVCKKCHRAYTGVA